MYKQKLITERGDYSIYYCKRLTKKATTYEWAFWPFDYGNCLGAEAG